MVQYDFNKGYMGERLKFAVTLFKKKQAYHARDSTNVTLLFKPKNIKKKFEIVYLQDKYTHGITFGKQSIENDRLVTNAIEM